MGIKVRKRPQKPSGEMLLNQTLSRLTGQVQNASLLRQNFIQRLLDPRRSIDEECGYPETISPEEYRKLYDREGVAKRVVKIWPEESWAMDPEVYENEEGDEETAFESEWKALQEEHNIYAHLLKVDEISGIGRFGVLLLGIDDGKELSQPVAGVEQEEKSRRNGEEKPTASKKKAARKLLYLRAFDESVVTIDQRDLDPQSRRFGKPTLYSIKFIDLDSNARGSGRSQTLKVHWTRVIHVADNRETSEILGQPRMEVVYNRIYDLQKVAAGSGEMFWKGGFPGYSFELSPEAEAAGAEIDADAMKEQIADWMNGLQRTLLLQGVTAKSLAVQVADPSSHVETIMSLLAFALGVPKRVFLGSEQAQLASTQDFRTWNRRVKRRQDRYVTPMILREFIKRLIAMGVLPTPAEFFIEWPDLNTVTDSEKADVAVKRTQALATYVSGNVDAIVPPLEYLTIVLEMPIEEATQILEAAEEYSTVLDEEQLHEAEMQLEADKIQGKDADSMAKRAKENGNGKAPPFANNWGKKKRKKKSKRKVAAYTPERN